MEITSQVDVDVSDPPVSHIIPMEVADSKNNEEIKPVLNADVIRHYGTITIAVLLSIGCGCE